MSILETSIIIANMVKLLHTIPLHFYRLSQFKKWALVGGVTFSIDFFFFAVTFALLNLPIWFSNSLSMLAGTLFNFLAHRVFTFSYRAGFVKSSYRYIIALILGYFTNTFFLYLLFHFGLSWTTVKVLASTLSAPMSFFILKFYVYRN